MSIEPREAATLVLMRDRHGAQPEVLMVQRHGQDVFAAGAFVFPGGVLEESDWSPEAIRLSDRLSTSQAHATLATVPEPDRALGFYLAAIRETFEEVGVLLARSESGEPWNPAAFPPERLRETRDALREGRLSFSGWLRDSRLRPAIESLVYFAHWVTPVGRPKRFDTRFFLSSAEEGIAVEPDQTEIVAYRWITPADAIAAYEQKTMRMVNATVKNLELLAEFGSVQEALAALRRRAVRAIRPRLVPLPDGGVRILLPWDPGYES